MIWFGKSFIKFYKSFINLIKLVSTQTSELDQTGTYPQMKCRVKYRGWGGILGKKGPHLRKKRPH